MSAGARDARTWRAFARGRVDGTGVRLSALTVLFLSFVVLTEWIRDREGEKFSAFTPRLIPVSYTHLTLPTILLV